MRHSDTKKVTEKKCRVGYYQTLPKLGAELANPPNCFGTFYKKDHEHQSWLSMERECARYKSRFKNEMLTGT